MSRPEAASDEGVKLTRFNNELALVASREADFVSPGQTRTTPRLTNAIATRNVIRSGKSARIRPRRPLIRFVLTHRASTFKTGDGKPPAPDIDHKMGEER